MNKKIIIILIILALVILNLALFTGVFKQNKACFRDFCLYGETKDPVNEFKTLLNSSDSFILYAEGDEEQTQTTGEISLAVLQLFSDLTKTQKPVTLVLVGFQDKTPVSCFCDSFDKGVSEPCNNDVSYCQSIQPAEKQMMFLFKYPSSQKNEAVIKGNLVTVTSNSGASLTGIVYVLRGLM